MSYFFRPNAGQVRFARETISGKTALSVTPYACTQKDAYNVRMYVKRVVNAYRHCQPGVLLSTGVLGRKLSKGQRFSVRIG